MTAVFARVAVIPEVPEPVTSPESVIVWSHVFVPLVFPMTVSCASVT